MNIEFPASSIRMNAQWHSRIRWRWFAGRLDRKGPEIAQIALILVVSVLSAGCDASNASYIPTVKPVQRIVGTLLDVPELGIRPASSIEVPQSRVHQLMSLAWPTLNCEYEIGVRSTPIATLEIFYEDGTKSELSVGWTGHNPAAVTLDNKNYYFGGSGDFPDGATGIARLLRDCVH